MAETWDDEDEAENGPRLWSAPVSNNHRGARFQASEDRCQDHSTVWRCSGDLKHSISSPGGTFAIWPRIARRARSTRTWPLTGFGLG
jgi:hypothetical protein